MAGPGRVVLEPTWILHARPWRDTSMLLEMLTRDHGRVGLVARGVRGPRGRWRALMQPLQPLLVSWSGRGELKNLSACEADGPALRLHHETLLAAWYVNELTMRLLQREDPHPVLFDAYSSVLAGLESGTVGALRLFEKRLLDELGWGPDFDRTADDGGAVEAGRDYGFTPDRGVLASAPGELTVSGATLLALAQERIDDAATANMARKVLAAALEPHLGGRPLHSRELLRALRSRKV